MRLLKKFIYGVLYLAVFGGIGFLIYIKATYVAPTCFDNIQNQMEEAVDCGPAKPGEAVNGPDVAVGTSCIPCELKHIELTKSEPKAYPVSATSSTVIVEIENKSLNYGIKKFNYTIRVFGKNSSVRLLEESGETSIYPGEKKYLAASAIGIDYREVGEMTIVPGPLNWVLKVTLPEKLNVNLSGTFYNASNSSISGFINNNSAVWIRSAVIVGIAYDATGRIVGATSAPFENIAPHAKNVPFNVFLQPGAYARVEAFLDLGVE